MSSSKDESSRASHEESSDVPKPQNMSEAAHILSSSRQEVDDNPSGEQIHEAAKVSTSQLVRVCTLYLCIVVTACAQRVPVLSEQFIKVLTSLRALYTCQCERALRCRHML
jgi:hypothetical protein